MNSTAIGLPNASLRAYTIAPQPKVIGYWVLYPGAAIATSFAMYHKPTYEQIKNTEALLGWGWKDAE